MNISEQIANSKSLFERLQVLLETYRGEDYVAGVKSAIEMLSSRDVPPDEIIRNVRATLKSMMGGMGTLGDFVIWDEDAEKQAHLNSEMNNLLTDLWNVLEC